MPASMSASSSSAVPTVNWPPGSSQRASGRRRGARARAGPRRARRPRGPRERRLATAEPTRPAPTMRMNTGHLACGASSRRGCRRRWRSASAAGPARPAARRVAAGAREDHPARGLATTYFVISPTKFSRGRRARRAARRRGSATAPRRPARSPRRPGAAPPRRSPGPARRARTVAVATWTPSYSSPTALARASAAARASSCASGRRASIGSDIGISKTHSASIVAPRPRSSLRVLVGGQAPGGLHDVVVERRAEDRHEDRAVLAPRGGSLRSARSGTVTRSNSGFPCARGR